MASKTLLRVGHLGIVDMPSGPVSVRVIEDRGPLGVEGRQLVRVTVLDGGEDMAKTLELPAEFLEEATSERLLQIGVVSAPKRRGRKTDAS